mgnify:CR=1 FL=1
MSIKAFSHFDQLNMVLPNALRSESVMKDLTDDQADYCQGGCLTLAYALCVHSNLADLGHFENNWFRNAELNYFPDGHFTTAFNCQGKVIFADGYGINDKQQLAQALADDAFISAVQPCRPVSLSEAKLIALESGIPIPEKQQLISLATAIDSELSSAPRHAVYFASEKRAISIGEALNGRLHSGLFTNCADAVTTINKHKRDLTELGQLPVNHPELYIHCAGIHSAKTLTDTDAATHGRFVDCSNMSELTHLKSYTVDRMCGLHPEYPYEIDMSDEPARTIIASHNP